MPTLRRKSSAKETSTFAIMHLSLFGLCMLVLAASNWMFASHAEIGLKAYRENNLLLLSTDSEHGEEANTQNQRRLRSEPTCDNPLSPPQGQALPLPSIRVGDGDEKVGREKKGTKYGGDGDKKHLGGFTKFDGQGVSPAVWQHMINRLGVKSMMDVGCGKGVSTLYFAEQGVDVLCLEGSHDAVEQTFLPNPETQVVEHDFSRGPYWPAKTYDAVWSVEFLEHVGRNYQHNYLQAFRKAAFIFASHSKWGGWHHVEVHDSEWWQTRFQMFGFQYSDILTQEIREVAKQERNFAKANPGNVTESIGPDGRPYNAQHVWLTMMVFVNPMVASLPEHAHLLAEPGCFAKRVPVEKGKQMKRVNRECTGTTETDLPESFKPLQLSKQGHQRWLDKVKASIGEALQEKQ